MIKKATKKTSHTKLTRTMREPKEDWLVNLWFSPKKKCFYLEQRFVLSSVCAPKIKNTKQILILSRRTFSTRETHQQIPFLFIFILECSLGNRRKCTIYFELNTHMLDAAQVLIWFMKHLQIRIVSLKVFKVEERWGERERERGRHKHIWAIFHFNLS